MKKDDLVVVEKLEGLPNAVGRPTEMKDWVAGQDNNGDEKTWSPVEKSKIKALPVSYTVKGELLKDISIGDTISIMRTERNGVEALGHFETSPVVSIEGDIHNTKNSMYRVQKIGMYE